MVGAGEDRKEVENGGGKTVVYVKEVQLLVGDFLDKPEVFEVEGAVLGDLMDVFGLEEKMGEPGLVLHLYLHIDH